MAKKVYILIIFLQNKDLVMRTNIPVHHLTTCENLSFNQCKKFSVFLLLFAKNKTSCHFEMAILHYIDGIGRK